MDAANRDRHDRHRTRIVYFWSQRRRENSPYQGKETGGVVMKCFYWDPFYIGKGNEQRNGKEHSCFSPLSLPPPSLSFLSHVAQSSLKPTAYPVSAF